MKKIVIVLPDLRGGGVEKMRLSLAKEWIKEGHQVEFVLLNAKGDLINAIPDGATLIDLKCNRMLQGLTKLTQYLKNTPLDVLLVAMWPLTILAILASIFSFKRKNFKLIISDHNTLSLSNRHKSSIYRKFLGLSVKILYPKTDCSIVVSKGVGVDLAKLSNLSSNFFKVIYNPAASKSTIKHEKKPFEFVRKGKNIISVGSLKEQKGFDLLIEAVSLLAKKENNFCLYILGEGELRTQLQNKIEQLNLSQYVKLIGFKHNVNAYFQHADLFVLSSLWEGFGNVIVESLNKGTPVVSTDCKSGPREILADGKYGKLVPVGDVDALAQAMYESLNEQHDKDALKRRSADFTVDQIALQYLDVMFPERLI